MRIRFWGTRGSIAKPQAPMLRYGGNTCCVEVRSDRGTLVVLDCGTGAHELGRALAREDVRTGHLLISHTHWDHIQGFAFFDPLFLPGATWMVYAPGGRAHDLEDTLAGQMAYQYSPISLDALAAETRFHNLTEGVFEVDGIRVRTQYLNHPALALAYRLETDGAALVYATDHEPHSLHPLDASPAAQPVHHEDRRHIRFLEGADLVIHDAQYTLSEFPAKAGWGHTPVERAVDYAVQAGVKKLLFTHHDPARDDEAVDAMVRMARDRASSVGSSLEVGAAAEGEALELRGSRPAPRDAERTPSSLLGKATRTVGTVLVVDDDPDMRLLLEATLRAEGMGVLTASEGRSAIEIAQRDKPSLILLDMALPGCDGLEVCRILRGAPDPRLHDVPIVILTGAKLKEEDLVQAFVAGATDYLTKPVKPTLVRSRVRGWLLRTASA